VIKKIAFELLDVVHTGRIFSVWHAPDVPAGGTIRLQAGNRDNRPWFAIESSDDASRMSVAVSFVDAQGRGGTVNAVAHVARTPRE
jgi:hypothetical protein